MNTQNSPGESSGITTFWNSRQGIVFGLLFTFVSGFLGHSINRLADCISPDQYTVVRFDFWLEVWSDVCMIFSITIAISRIIPKCRCVDNQTICQLVMMMCLEITFFTVQFACFLAIVMLSLIYMGQLCVGKDAMAEPVFIVIVIHPIILKFSAIRISEIDRMRDVAMLAQQLGIPV